MLESQTLPILDLSGDNIKAQKEAWIDRESRNRYAMPLNAGSIGR